MWHGLLSLNIFLHGFSPHKYVFVFLTAFCVRTRLAIVWIVLSVSSSFTTRHINSTTMLCVFFCFFFTFILSHTHEPLSSASVFLPGIKRPAGGWKMWVIFLFYFIYIIHFHIFYNWLTESHNSHYKYLFQCKDNATFSFIAHIFGRLDKGGRNWETRVIMLHRFTIWMYWLDI